MSVKGSNFNSGTGVHGAPKSDEVNIGDIGGAESIPWVEKQPQSSGGNQTQVSSSGENVSQSGMTTANRDNAPDIGYRQKSMIPEAPEPKTTMLVDRDPDTIVTRKNGDGESVRVKNLVPNFGNGLPVSSPGGFEEHKANEVPGGMDYLKSINSLSDESRKKRFTKSGKYAKNAEYDKTRMNIWNRDIVDDEKKSDIKKKNKRTTPKDFVQTEVTTDDGRTPFERLMHPNRKVKPAIEFAEKISSAHPENAPQSHDYFKRFRDVAKQEEQRKISMTLNDTGDVTPDIPESDARSMYPDIDVDAIVSDFGPYESINIGSGFVNVPKELVDYNESEDTYDYLMPDDYEVYEIDGSEYLLPSMESDEVVSDFGKTEGEVKNESGEFQGPSRLSKIIDMLKFHGSDWRRFLKRDIHGNVFVDENGVSYLFGVPVRVNEDGSADVLSDYEWYAKIEPFSDISLADLTIDDMNNAISDLMMLNPGMSEDEARTIMQGNPHVVFESKISRSKEWEARESYRSLSNEPIVRNKHNRKKSDEDLLNDRADQIWKTTRDTLKNLYPDMALDIEDEYVSISDYELKGKKADENRKSSKWHERLRAQLFMIRLYLNPYELKIQGDRLVSMSELFPESGRSDSYVKVHDEAVQEALVMVMQKFDISEAQAIQMVILRASLGIDQKLQIGKVDYRDFELSQTAVISMCEEIIASTNRYNNPLAIVMEERNYIENTPAFPLGYMPKLLAKQITESPNSYLYQQGITHDTLMKMIHDEWLNRTQGTILDNTRSGHAVSQRLAIDNMMRAMMRIDGVNPAEWNISNELDKTYLEMISETENVPDDSDMKPIFEMRDRQAQDYIKRLRKRYARQIISKGADGTWQTSYVSKQNAFMDTMGGIATWMRFAGVVANPAVIIPGYFEHISGNMYQKAANGFLGHMAGKDFRPSRFAVESIKSEGSIAIQISRALYNIGGIDALRGYVANANGNYSLEGAREFIDEYIRNQKDPRKISKLRHEAEKWVNLLVPGSLGMQGCDARRFVEMLMINNARTKELSQGNVKSGNEKDIGRGYVDSSGFDEAIRAQGVTSTMLESMLTDEGIDAFVASSNLNLGRISPVSYAINRMLHANGISEFVMTDMLDTYIEYGVNAVLNVFPMSNTLSYLVSKGVASGYMIWTDKVDARTLMREGLRNQEGKPEFINYQLGGNDTFWYGLRKNMTYDMMKLGNFMLVACFCAVTIMALGGIDDPPEGADKYNWLQYLIGSDDPNTPEDERKHMPIPAWWAYDLLGWGMGAGVALLAQVKHPEDPTLGLNIWSSAMYDCIDGTSFMDMLNAPKNVWNDVNNMINDINNDEWVAPDNLHELLSGQANHQVANFIRKMTPAIINNWGPGTRDTLLTGRMPDRTASKVYDTDNYTPEEARALNKTKSIDDYVQRMIRQDSKGNILWGLINNLRFNGSLLTPEDSENTGYLFWEMPIATAKDQIRSTFMNEFSILKDEIIDDSGKTAGELDYESYLAWCDTKIQNSIYSLETEWNGDPRLFVANGGMIDFTMRKMYKTHAYEQILLADNDYDQKLKAGMSYEESVHAKNKRDNIKNYWYDFIKKWVDNEEIPWSDDGYVKMLSDSYDTYYYPDGTPAKPWSYFIDPSVQKVSKPIGNNPTSLLPFTFVNVDDTTGYNAETKVEWWVDGLSDPNLIKERLGESRIPIGQDKGKIAKNVSFGATGGEPGQYVEGQDLSITDGMVPTIDRRSYVPQDSASMKKLLDNIKIEDVAKSMGIDYDALKNGKNSKANYSAWTKSTGRSYGGGSGSRGSYIPKIYSNDAQVNNDRASTMNTRTPYSAKTSSYLRPGFATKGSRESYRRSDI